MRARKILLAGAAAVGKTSLSRRMKFDTFEAVYKSTIGVQLHEVRLEVDGESMQLVLWDTDGNFGEAIFDAVYAKGSSAAILVSDVSRRVTVDAMLDIAAKFERSFPGRPALCVLNKVDLVAPDASLLDQVGRHSDEIALCSAKTGAGVREALARTCRLILARDAM